MSRLDDAIMPDELIMINCIFAEIVAFGTMHTYTRWENQLFGWLASRITITAMLVATSAAADVGSPMTCEIDFTHKFTLHANHGIL